MDNLKEKIFHTMKPINLCFFRDNFLKDLDIHPQYFWHCMQNEIIHSQNFTNKTISV